MLKSTFSVSSIEDKQQGNLSQIANMREVLQGKTLKHFCELYDSIKYTIHHMKELTKEIKGRDGIQNRQVEIL